LPGDEAVCVATLPARIAGGWYACHTRPRAEKRAHALLCDRDVESYLPAVSRVQRWSDRKRTVVLPLFTGYVFVRSAPIWLLVDTPGICDVVRFDGRPAVISDREIRNVRRFVQALTGTPREVVAVAFHEGDRVRITSGPFQDVEAVVIRARNRCRLIVGLAAIGAGFAVDVPVRAVVAV